MIPYQPVDPDDQPSRAELDEPREDTRDYHDGEDSFAEQNAEDRRDDARWLRDERSAAARRVDGWLMTDPPFTAPTDRDYIDGIPF